MAKSFFSKVAMALVSAALVSAQSSCDWLTQDTPTGPLYIKLAGTNSATYPNAATTWSRIAIDGYPSPTASSITINTGDFTYSSSAGQSVAHSVTKVPYAAAFGCVGTNVADGWGKIDLTGTPFSVQSGAGQFKFGGWYPKGVFTCTSDNKQCTLNCGGYCGFCGPATGMNLGEDANRRGGKYLVLDVADQNTFSYCVNQLAPKCDWLQKDTNGKYYVTLAGTNSATYPNAATTWNKIAISGTPSSAATSVTIDSSDFTYSSSSGQSVAHSVTKVPYAAAFGCVGTNVADGLAKIDLTGTPFSVRNGAGQFSFGGWYPKGVFSCTTNNKQCTLNCGGYCGFCGPVAGMNLGEDANRRGGNYLVLDVADTQTYSYCAALKTAVSSASSSHSHSQSSFGSNMQVLLGVFVCVVAVQVVAVAVVLRRRRQPLAAADHVQLQETSPATA